MTSMILVRDQRKDRLEQGLPGYMFSLLFESLRQNHGLTVRADLEELANKASILPLQNATRFEQVSIGKQMQDEGHAILSAANEDNIPTLTAGLARLICTLASRGVYVEDNALMVALAIASEADETNDWGRPKSINKAMVKIDNAARSLGYFVTATTVTEVKPGDLLA